MKERRNERIALAITAIVLTITAIGVTATVLSLCYHSNCYHSKDVRACAARGILSKQSGNERIPQVALSQRRTPRQAQITNA